MALAVKNDLACYYNLEDSRHKKDEDIQVNMLDNEEAYEDAKLSCDCNFDVDDDEHQLYLEYLSSNSEVDIQELEGNDIVVQTSSTNNEIKFQGLSCCPSETSNTTCILEEGEYAVQQCKFLEDHGHEKNVYNDPFQPVFSHTEELQDIHVHVNNFHGNQEVKCNESDSKNETNDGNFITESAEYSDACNVPVLTEKSTTFTDETATPVCGLVVISERETSDNNKDANDTNHKSCDRSETVSLLYGEAVAISEESVDSKNGYNDMDKITYRKVEEKTENEVYLNSVHEQWVSDKEFETLMEKHSSYTNLSHKKEWSSEKYERITNNNKLNLGFSVADKENDREQMSAEYYWYTNEYESSDDEYKHKLKSVIQYPKEKADIEHSGWDTFRTNKNEEDLHTKIVSVWNKHDFYNPRKNLTTQNYRLKRLLKDDKPKIKVGIKRKASDDYEHVRPKKLQKTYLATFLQDLEYEKLKKDLRNIEETVKSEHLKSYEKLESKFKHYCKNLESCFEEKYLSQYPFLRNNLLDVLNDQRVKMQQCLMFGLEKLDRKKTETMARVKRHYEDELLRVIKIKEEIQGVNELYKNLGEEYNPTLMDEKEADIFLLLDTVINSFTSVYSGYQK